MAEISGYSCSGLPNLPRTQQFPWLLPHAGLTICQFTRKTRKVSAARVRPSRRHVAAYREAFSRASPPPSPSSPPSRFVSAAIRAYRRVTHEWPLCAPMNRWSYKNLICPPLTSFFVRATGYGRDCNEIFVHLDPFSSNRTRDRTIFVTFSAPPSVHSSKIRIRILSWNFFLHKFILWICR